MFRRDFIICFICFVIAAGFIFAAGSQLDYINSQRKSMDLVINEPLENAPPSLAFATVAMGAFRGLIVDVLWIRADRLKDKGQFFDARQLAEWITTLQPRFPEVWGFQAWNMAYNISVTMPASQPQERWRWVKNGYELLRDKGIVFNPGSITLYQELARIFQHKIGSYSDDAHKYYKIQLAEAMQPLLGSADEEYFDRLAKAPTSLEQIQNDPGIKALVDALKLADKAFEDEKNFPDNYLAFRTNPSRFSDRAFAVIDTFRGNDALNKLDFFAKAYNLRNTWKLDPVIMQRINQRYGPVDFDSDPNEHLPMDWRNANTHAIYWALRGLEAIEKGRFSIGEANTDRIINYALQNLFRDGKIFIFESSPTQRTPEDQIQRPGKDIYLRSDLRMFESYNKSTLAIIEKYKGPKLRRGTYQSMQIGHRNMLINAIFSFYQAGHRRQAQHVYNQLRELYPSEDVNIPLVIFVKKRFAEEFKNITIDNAKEMIQMILRESYFRYAVHDDDDAFNLENLAQQIYRHYQRSYSDENRIDLPDLYILKYSALIDFYQDSSYPLDLRQIAVNRIKMERPELAEKLKHLEQRKLQHDSDSENER